MVVFGGDFRQTLPVVPREGRGGITSKIFKTCSFWKEVQTLKLSINERVRQNGDTEQSRNFADFLVTLGEGNLPTIPQIGPDYVQIPEQYIFPSDSPSDFIQWCYPNLDDAAVQHDFSHSAILAPKNKEVDMLNKTALNMMYGSVQRFESADSVLSDDPAQAILFPVEYLYTVTASGLPPHILELKENCPVILLRTLDQQKGLCNGTRLTVKQIGRKFLKVVIASGSHIGNEAFIPRIDHRTDKDFLPFILNRSQFPVKLAFAVTINKSQGQSLTRTGIWLNEPVFFPMASCMWLCHALEYRHNQKIS